jgi:hypothetical protein
MLEYLCVIHFSEEVRKIKPYYVTNYYEQAIFFHIVVHICLIKW